MNEVSLAMKLGKPVFQIGGWKVAPASAAPVPHRYVQASARTSQRSGGRRVAVECACQPRKLHITLRQVEDGPVMCGLCRAPCEAPGDSGQDKAGEDYRPLRVVQPLRLVRDRVRPRGKPAMRQLPCPPRRMISATRYLHIAGQNLRWPHSRAGCMDTTVEISQCLAGGSGFRGGPLPAASQSRCTLELNGLTRFPAPLSPAPQPAPRRPAR
jgi:hypothetical protein